MIIHCLSVNVRITNLTLNFLLNVSFWELRALKHKSYECLKCATLNFNLLFNAVISTEELSTNLLYPVVGVQDQ